jgi:hypothetical protein
MRTAIATLVILLPMALHSQNEARKKPLAAAEATALGNAETTSGIQNQADKDIVSLNASGDPTITIPFLTIESRTMQIPVDLHYSPGIKVDARSGPVGLGWNVSFGSIVRDYGAYEPDYSTITHETEMRSANGQMNLAAFAQQGLNNKTLAYDGLPADQFTPDKYHVSLPGRSGGTFWNKNGPPATEHAFVFNGGEPWKVRTEVTHFSHPQEISRINEYNWLTIPEASNTLNKRGSFATAIGFAPYVTGTNPDITVSSPFGTTQPWDNLENVSYDDLGSFVITTDDGTQYVFDRPLIGQKYLFSEDPYWSLVNRPNDADYVQSNSIKGEWWKTEYVAEWLLTAILSYDYIDANANGKADDGDLGDWVRIEYTEPTQLEQRLVLSNLQVLRPVPKHREWSNFTQTDQASSLMRELAYVTRIVTPVKEYRFDISQRMDVDHDFFSKPANCIGNNEYIYEDLHFTNDPEEGDATFDLKYPVETMKYDQVTTYDRTKDIALYPLEGRALRTTKLRYAEKGSAEELAVSKYLIRTNENVEFNLAGPEHHFSPSAMDDHLVPNPALPNSFSIEAFNVEVINAQANTQLKGRGKTTLLGVDHLSGNGTDPTNKQSYSFEYGYNPSYSEIHKREIVRKRFFPVKRQSGRNQPQTGYPPVRDFLSPGSTNHPSEFLFDGPSLAINYALEHDAAVELISDEVVAFDFLSPGNNGAFDAFSASFSESNPDLIRQVVNKNSL